jgi:hypothetical protein
MPEPTVAQLKATIDELYDTVDSLKAQLTSRDKKIAATEQKLAETTKRHHGDVLNAEFSRIAASMGIPADAIPDVLSGIPAAGWAVNDKGEPEFRDPKTGSPFYDVTLENWFRDQVNAGGRWAYLTRNGPSQAGSGGQGVDAGGGRNPWSKESWDDMEQARVYRADPVRAEQLAKLAGSRIGALKPS